MSVRATVVALLGAVVLAACGGSVDGGSSSASGGAAGVGGSAGAGAGGAGGSGSVGGSAGVGAGGSGGSVACEPLPGCSSTTECQVECNTCTCVEGQWECTGLACLDGGPPPPPADCPSAPPSTGSYCPIDGQVCAQYGFCSPECTCSGNVWSCVEYDCAGCPPTVPEDGSPCDPAIAMCSFGSGCDAASCTCVPQGGWGAWQCSHAGCIDAGSGSGGAAGGP